jgi:hypothetical protein
MRACMSDFGWLLTGCFMTLDRQLLLDPVVRATTEQRRYLVDRCLDLMKAARTPLHTRPQPSLA